MQVPKEIIRIGQLELRFLLDGDDTDNQLVVFELIVPANAKVPASHYHVEVAEVIYGLEGVLTYYLEGEAHHLSKGDKCYVPKGAVHGFKNHGQEDAKALCVLTPASIGPAYFRELALMVNAGGPPDPNRVGELMQRYGLLVSPLPMD